VGDEDRGAGALGKTLKRQLEGAGALVYRGDGISHEVNEHFGQGVRIACDE